METEKVNNINVVYPGGALRASVKPYYHLITPEFLENLAKALTKGEIKYPSKDGVPNYTLGDESFMAGTYDHAMEHLTRGWNSGTMEEALEHIGHCAANLMILDWFIRNKHKKEEVIDGGEVKEEESKPLYNDINFQKFFGKLFNKEK